MSEDNGLPRITLDSEFAPAPTFEVSEWVGEIIADESRVKPEKFGGGHQWAYAVRPLDGFVKGKTGAFWEYPELPADGKVKEGTKLALTLDAFKEVFGTNNTPIMQGEFIGKVAVFSRYTKVWGVNTKTGAEMKGTVLLPVRAATDDELRKYGKLGANDSTSFEFTPENIAAAVDVLDGVKKSGVKLAVANGGLTDPALVQRLLNGEAVTYLVENGHLVVGGDNVYHKVEAA